MTADEFKEERVRLGMTQAQIAARLGITWRQVQNYESSHTPVPKLVSMAIKNFKPRKQRSEEVPA